MAENLLALAVRPLDVATPLLQARQIQRAESETAKNDQELRQSVMGSEFRGLTPFVNHPEFGQRWTESMDRMAQRGILDPQRHAQLRNSPSALLLQQGLAMTSSGDQFLKMQQMARTRAADAAAADDLYGGSGAAATPPPMLGSPVSPTSNDPTMSIPDRQVREANAAPLSFNDRFSAISAPRPDQQSARPVQTAQVAPPAPAAPSRGISPNSPDEFASEVNRLTRIASNRDVSERVAKTAELKLKSLLEQSNDWKNYQRARASGDPAAARPFTEWLVQVKAAGASKVTVDQRGETKFDEAFGAAQAKRWNGYIEGAQTAQRKLVDIQTMREISPRVGSQGAAAGVKEALGPYAEAIGINIDNLSDIQAYTSIIERLTPQQRVPGSGSTSDVEYKGMRKAMPSLLLNPAARDVILDTMEAIERTALAEGEIATRLSTKEITRTQAEQELRRLGDPMKRFSEWRKANPVLYNRALKEPPRAVVPSVGEVRQGYKFTGGDPSDPKNWQKQ